MAYIFKVDFLNFGIISLLITYTYICLHTMRTIKIY